MPPRIARSSVAKAVPKNVKNKSKKRQLDAYSIASHSAPEKLRIRQHRLGETIDDEPRQKRRRLQDDDEDSEGEERIDSARMRQERNVTKRTGTGAMGGLDEEGVEYLSDSDGGEIRMGGLGSEDEDSDIDSDEAFGESDEERFSGFTFRGSKSGKGKKGVKKQAKKAEKLDEDGDLDLNEQDEEDEEDEDDDFGEEGVDLATMLDDDDEAQLGGKDKTREDMGEESASDEEDSGEESQSSSEDEDQDEEQPDDEERHARLQDFVEALDAKSAKDKARIMSDEDGGLTVDDLLADADLDKATMANFKPKRKSKAPQTLKAPLPKRQQDRIDREIATEKAKEQLDRWQDTVVQNRRADFLSFPLKNPDEGEPIGKDKLTTVKEDKPRTELEQSIQKIMEESGLATNKDKKGDADEAEQDLLKAEGLETNQVPVEEALRRRAELRRNRALMFQEEIKAKRLAKIKSKSYRRVHRKQREREAEKERSAMIDAGLVPEMDEDEKELADRRRAEARMGTKHKDSKWAKSLKATDRAVWDDTAREGVVEQARRQEELKKRVAGKDIGESGSEAESDADDESDEDGAVTLKQLEKLGQTAPPEKGIAAMKFMRNADERRKAENDQAAEQLRREMAGEPSEEEEEEDESLGRAIFGPSTQNQNEKPAPKAKRPELEEGVLSDEEKENSHEADSKTEGNAAAKQDQKKPKSAPKKADKASGSLAKGQVKERRQPAQDKPAKENDDTSGWLSGPSKSKKKSKADKQANAGANDELITTTVASKPASKQQQKANKPKAGKAAVNASASSTDDWTTLTHNGDQSSDEEDNEHSNPMLSAKDSKKALYTRAFAGDDVEQSFASEKQALADEEDSKEVSTHMPGWGTWAGEGLSKFQQKKAERARHNPLYKKKLAGVEKADRKDARMKDVIVSEKSERKGKKYLAPVLPHQFERGDEYERSLRLPIGKEWGTKETVQRSTRPRVVTKPGKVIEAVERPMI